MREGSQPVGARWGANRVSEGFEEFPVPIWTGSTLGGSDLYAVLAALAWFTMGEGKVSSWEGKPVELRRWFR
jgi:hypothetical protein